VLQGNGYVVIISTCSLPCNMTTTDFEDCMPLGWAGPLLPLCLSLEYQKEVQIFGRVVGPRFIQVKVDKPPIAHTMRGTLPKPAWCLGLSPKSQRRWDIALFFEIVRLMI